MCLKLYYLYDIYSERSSLSFLQSSPPLQITFLSNSCIAQTLWSYLKCHIGWSYSWFFEELILVNVWVVSMYMSYFQKSFSSFICKKCKLDNLSKQINWLFGCKIFLFILNYMNKYDKIFVFIFVIFAGQFWFLDFSLYS